MNFNSYYYYYYYYCAVNDWCCHYCCCFQDTLQDYEFLPCQIIHLNWIEKKKNIWFCPHLLMFFSFHFSVWKKVFSDSFRYWATQILEQFTNSCINLATVRFVTTYVFIETDLGKSQKPFIWLGLTMLDNQITSSKNVAVKENVLSNYTVTLSSVYISTRCLLMCNIQMPV